MNPFRRLVRRLISPQLRYCPRDTEYLAKKQSFEGKCEISGTISQPKKSSADVLVNQKAYIKVCFTTSLFFSEQHL